PPRRRCGLRGHRGTRPALHQRHGPRDPARRLPYAAAHLVPAATADRHPPPLSQRPMGSRVTVLAGGDRGGEARLGCSLASAPRASWGATPLDLAVVVNTGDDLEVHGLSVSPDLDTVMYTLAGLANDATGWGVRDETWNGAAMLERLGAPTWFGLGD